MFIKQKVLLYKIMKTSVIIAGLMFGTMSMVRAQETVTTDTLTYHAIRIDTHHHILPWYNPDPGISYDHVLHLVWHFWSHMRRDYNGLPYYMNHQVWKPDVDDRRGIGGDQLFMALSSWRLWYQYTGDENVKENMKFIADYYLAHGMSPADCAWPDIPFPYNTNVYSGKYDGGMILGPGYAQPDKAGSFGLELIHLYKMTGHEYYLDAAVKIANTLAIHVQKGDADHSPMPFKVNVYTGETGALRANSPDHSVIGKSAYTTNWTGTLELWSQLRQLKKGETGNYKSAFDTVLDWMVKYPLQNNKWGPFFEDVPGWSDTEINAATFAFYIMQHRDLFPRWQTQVRGIFDWIYKELGNNTWKKYGVMVVNEQTAYRVPGNSHTSRQASVQLWYNYLSGDTTMKQNAVRELNWATYMVRPDGANRYPHDDIWLTDGYGDYVRHFLRAMAADPQLAPPGQDHILWTTSVIQKANYAPNINKYWPTNVDPSKVSKVLIYYQTFDKSGSEILRLRRKPSGVRAGNSELKEVKTGTDNGYTWQPLENGGILRVYHKNSGHVTIWK